MNSNDSSQIYTHYRKSNIDALKVARAWNLPASLFSVLKYVQRAGIKHSEPYEKDMLKAVWYLAYETAFQTLDHEDAVETADRTMEFLRQSCLDLMCPKLIDARHHSSDSQSELDFPLIGESNLPDGSVQNDQMESVHSGQDD